MKSAYGSYKMVCGQGNVPGDGVVPLEAAHLEGAACVTLPCYHSISPVNDPFGSVRGTWYGSQDMVDQWLTEVWAGIGTKAPQTQPQTLKTTGNDAA